jgi:ribonuclease D
MAHLEDLTPGFVERSGGAILELIDAAGLPAVLPPLPPRSRPDPELQAQAKRLANLVQQRASELGVAAELLATRRELESIVRGERTAEVLSGWRREVIGAELLAAG